jgi:hypothetical protein
MAPEAPPLAIEPDTLMGGAKTSTFLPHRQAAKANQPPRFAHSR